jgi:two-component system OmpR family sensor kinase
VNERPLDVLAHELRSPVAALGAIAEAYAGGTDESGAARRARLLELADSAVAAIERLLVDAAPASLRREDVDVAALVRDAAEAAVLRGANVTAETPAGLVVDGDAARLRQALDNLIGNAVGHSPAGGLVTVSVRDSGGLVEIDVRDEGEGLDPADMERVFEPGVRLTSAPPGQGLGLAIVKAIAERHGARLVLGDTPGGGLTVRVAFPERAAGPPAVAAPDAADASSAPRPDRSAAP